MNDRFDSQISPLNDFVDDSAISRLWDVVHTAGIAVYGGINLVFGWLMHNHALLKTIADIMGKFIEILKLIKAIVLDAAKAPQGKIEKEALRIVVAYDYFFKNTQTLAVELEKAVKDLNSAIEGVRVLPAPAGAGMGASHVSGGAVINIAINQGATGQAVGDAVQNIGTGGTSGGGGGTIGNLNQPIYLDRLSTLRRLVLQIAGEWNNLQVNVSLFKAAQNQLTRQAPPPKKPANGQ